MKDIDRCNLCGRCNTTCAIFLLLKRETQSNRHKAQKLRDNKEDRSLFRALMDSSAKRACPASIDLDEEIVRYRHMLVRNRIESPSNKEMIENLRNYGNPLGRITKKKQLKPLF